MFLKRLELQGFKSFADKTVLDFTDGATAVVGPNGSGKSNISDAIRWVIGEKSAKSLRGSNMQDVIFAGTEARRPLNFAEVSLVLDNSTHIFNIDFEEITVTRRLFRSGESAYRINGANCRLKDIHELFMDTGLGRDGYSIIGQGNVAQILSTKAEDRRSLFEEAAGVAKYKYRRDETARKLASTEENLIRIGDITTELETQIGPLKRQSEKARKYLDLYGEYKRLDINLSMLTLEKNRAESEKADMLYDGAAAELAERKAKSSEAEKKMSELYSENRKIDSERDEKSMKLMENEGLISEAEREISLSENNIENNFTLSERVDNEIEAMQKRIAERENQIDGLNAEISEKQDEGKRIHGEFDAEKSETEKIAQMQDALRAEIDSLKGDIIELMNSAAAKKAKMSGMESLRKNFLDRRAAVETEIGSFRAGVENKLNEIKETEEKLSEKTQKLEKMRASVEKHRDNADRLGADISDITVKLNSAQLEQSSKSSKKTMLESMENDYAGYAKSVKAVLKADELKRLAIYGAVSGLIDVKREYVTAIEQALGGAMQNIIVESENDAKKAIEYLRRTNAGRATFLPVTSVNGRTLDNVREISRYAGFIGIASELISYDKKYDGIMKSLLGRTVVVDNMDNAIAMSRAFGYKFRVVTLEGDILNAGGSMSGGSVNKQSGFLSRAAEIKELSRDLTRLAADVREMKAKKESLERDLSLVNDQLSAYEPIMRGYEDEILTLKNNAVYLKESLETGENTEAGLKAELEQIESNLSESSDEIAAILQSIRDDEKRTEALNAGIEEKESRYAEISAEKEEKTQSIVDRTLLLNSVEKDIEALRAGIETAKREIEQSGEEISQKELEKERINRETQDYREEIVNKRASIEKLRGQSENIKSEISALDERKQRVNENIQKMQSSNKDLTDTLLALQQELSRLENRREKLETERENVINHLWEDYELSPSGAEELRGELEDEKEAVRRAAELKAKLKALGSVNMDAIEEFKEVKERFEFLSAQKSDLEKAKENLTKLVASTEDIMRDKFTDQLEVINDSFGKVFRELFGGGQGRLYLSEPDNVLESGIEIEIQLPGKSRQNLNLYSGGEKSFIAIALLFAILRVKPTPFCILDEIDAALDDVNVARFATYLKNYIEDTQFIVITHRRGTMEAATILYGVTMQEKGISKLLSLQIDDVDGEMVS